MIRGGLIGAAIGGMAMSLWISFVNRPLIEQFTIVYEGRELHAQGQTGWRRVR